MFSFLSSLISFLMYWMFLYVGSFLLMIVAIFYIIKTNPSPPTPIIHQHYSTVQVVEPPKRVLIEELQSFTNIIQQFKWLNHQREFW